MAETTARSFPLRTSSDMMSTKGASSIAQAFMQRRNQQKQQQPQPPVAHRHEVDISQRGAVADGGRYGYGYGRDEDEDDLGGADAEGATTSYVQRQRPTPDSNGAKRHQTGGGAALQRIAALRGGLPIHRREAPPKHRDAHDDEGEAEEASRGVGRHPTNHSAFHDDRYGSPNQATSRSGSVGQHRSSSADHHSHTNHDHYAAYEQHVSSHRSSRTGSVDNIHNGRGSFKSEGRASVGSAGFSGATGAVNFEDLPAGVKSRQEVGVYNENAVPPVDEILPTADGGPMSPYPPTGAASEHPATQHGDSGDEGATSAQLPLAGNRPKILRRGEGQRRILRAHQQARPAGEAGGSGVDPAVLGGPNVGPPISSGRPSANVLSRVNSRQSQPIVAKVDDNHTSPRGNNYDLGDEPRSPDDPHASTLRPEEPIVARQLPPRTTTSHPTPQPSTTQVNHITRPPTKKPIPAHLLHTNTQHHHPSLRHAEGIQAHLAPVLEGADEEELEVNGVLGVFDEGGAAQGGGSIEGSVAAAERLLTRFLDSKRAEFLNAQLTYPLDNTNAVSKYVPRFASADGYFRNASKVGEFAQVTRVLDSIGSR